MACNKLLLLWNTLSLLSLITIPVHPVDIRQFYQAFINCECSYVCLEPQLVGDTLAVVAWVLCSLLYQISPLACFRSFCSAVRGVQWGLEVPFFSNTRNSFFPVSLEIVFRLGLEVLFFPVSSQFTRSFLYDDLSTQLIRAFYDSTMHIMWYIWDYFYVNLNIVIIS